MEGMVLNTILLFEFVSNRTFFIVFNLAGFLVTIKLLSPYMKKRMLIAATGRACLFN